MLVAEEIAATLEREGPRIYGGAKAAATATGAGAGDLLPQIAKLVRRGGRAVNYPASAAQRAACGARRASARA